MVDSSLPEFELENRDLRSNNVGVGRIRPSRFGK